MRGGHVLLELALPSEGLLADPAAVGARVEPVVGIGEQPVVLQQVDAVDAQQVLLHEVGVAIQLVVAELAHQLVFEDSGCPTIGGVGGMVDSVPVLQVTDEAVEGVEEGVAQVATEDAAVVLGPDLLEAEQVEEAVAEHGLVGGPGGSPDPDPFGLVLDVGIGYGSWVNGDVFGCNRLDICYHTNACRVIATRQPVFNLKLVVQKHRL